MSRGSRGKEATRDAFIQHPDAGSDQGWSASMQQPPRGHVNGVAPVTPLSVALARDVGGDPRDECFKAENEPLVSSLRHQLADMAGDERKPLGR